MALDANGWTYGLPPGVKNEEGVHIVRICLIVMIGSTFFCFARFLARSVVIRRWAVDDTVLLFAWICAAAYGSMAIAQTRFGLGLPPSARPSGKYLQTYTYINFTGRFVYTTGISLFKISFVLALLRFIYNLPSLKSLLNIWRPWLWISFWYITLSHIAQNLVLLLLCSPISKSWHPTTAGVCLDSTKTFYVMGANTIFCDVLTLAIAIPLILRMALTKTDRITIAGLYSLGVFTAACGAVRMWQIKKISVNGDSSGLVEWGVVEINVGVALVAIPAATPIVDAIRGYTLSYPRGPSDPPHWSRPASLTLMYAALFWILCKLCCCEKKAKSVYADYLAPRDGNIELNSQHDRSFRRVRSPISQDQLCRGTAAEHYHFQESYLTRFGRSISSVLGGPSNSHEESPVEFATRQYTDRGSSNYQDSSIPTSHRRSGPTRRTDGAGQPKGATRPTSGEGIPQPMLPPHTPPELSSHASGDSSSIATYAGSFVHPVHRDSLRSVATPHRELLGSSHSSPFSLDIQPKPDPTSPNLSDADNEVFEPNADFTAPLCPLPTMLRTSGSVQGVPRQSPPEVYLPTRPRSGSLPSLPSSPMLSSSLRHARSREESGTQRGLTVMESYDISADTLQGRGRQGRMVLSRVSEGEED